jgi:3-deoxy-D-manno-octulosonic-acid transferase
MIKLKKALKEGKNLCIKFGLPFQKTDKVIWMHAASLGEYEQGLPVLEKLKEKFPDHKILVTFFLLQDMKMLLKRNILQM